MALTGREMRPCWPRKVAVCNRKAGGSWHTISGQIKKIDDYQKQVILLDKTRIDIDCILNIDGEIFGLTNESETDFD